MTERQAEKMSKEAVLKVKEAESEAKRILDEAHAKSRKMISDAESAAQTECDSFENMIRADYKSRVEIVRRNAQDIVDQNRAEDEKKYIANEKVAQGRMNDAVKIILQGVMSECQ